MPLAGFSEDDAPLAIGYYLGLRWFQADQASHDTWEFRVSSHDGTTASCSCGQQAPIENPAEMPDWHDAHVNATSCMVLRGARDPWKPGVNQAHCLAGNPHTAPTRACGCGFWAYWRLAGDRQVGHPHVAALIKGYGKVIKGPRGFRCEKAEIVGLVPPGDGTSQWAGTSAELLALALEEAYAPAEVYGSVAALLERHKAPDSQPPLGDDWSTASRQAQEQRQGATGGYISTGSSHWYPVGSASVTYAGNGGTGNVIHHPGGAGGTASAMSAALRSGPMPCGTCGRMACAIGQARCVPCELDHVRAGIAGSATQMKALQAPMQQAITGVDALNQLQARQESWDNTSFAQWVMDFVKRKFGS